MQQGVASNALILNDQGKFLMVKRSDDDEYLPGSWELPGGRVEFGETPQQSLEREVIEECGLRVTIGFPVGVHVFDILDNGATVQVTEITFLCSLQDSKIVRLSDEHSAYRWISQEEFETLEATDYMKQLIADAFVNPAVK